MPTRGFYVNLSMLGVNATGLGVYATRCARCIERHFSATIVSTNYQPADGTHLIRSPSNITIGSGRLAAILRVVYGLMSFPGRDGFVYTPSHHGPMNSRNQVVTVLDLIALHHPRQHLLQHLYFRWILPRLLKRSRAVFTLSEAVRREITDVFGLDPNRIHVVPCGVDRETYQPGSSSASPQQPFLLVVGAAYRHKNIEELLRQHDLWTGKYKLLIVSAFRRHVRRLKALVRALGIEDHVEFEPYLSTHSLVRRYQECEAVVAPSQCEGFGLTPLEALACGRPVIVSDMPVHREVLGEAGIYVTLGDRQSWEGAFETLADEVAVRRKIALGVDRVRQHSWERSCSSLISALLAVEPALAGLYKGPETVAPWSNRPSEQSQGSE